MSQALTLAAAGFLFILSEMKSRESAKKKPINHSFDPPNTSHPEVPSGPSLKPTPHPNLSIRIIVPSGSSGTDFDAWVYQTLLPESVIVYIDQETIDSYSGPTRDQHFDVNFFIERILGRHLFPSTYEWIMVNQEMLRVRDESLEGVDLVLCKSRYAWGLLMEYLRDPGKVKYVCHASRDIGVSKKTYELAIHPAGKSWLKGTFRLIKAWMKVDPPALLVVTCREMCMDPTRIQKLLSEHFHHEPKSGRWVYAGHKTRIEWSAFLSQDELSDIQSRAGLWLCPSEVEGYGHYINEGRSAGAVVMTTDFPPMNELIDSESGFLVDLDRKTKIAQEGQLPGSKRVFPRTANIARTLTKIFSTPRVELERLGSEARKRYDHDLEFLSSSMASVVKDFSPMLGEQFFESD